MLLSFESPEKEQAGLVGEILSLLQRGFLPKEIVILQRHRGGNERLARELRRRGIAATIVRGELNLADEAVKLCTLHSVKGLECEVVFIAGLEEFRVDRPV
ncbi:MAG: hypothetical protein Kow0031_12270 [Anaerolineae bacterium]